MNQESNNWIIIMHIKENSLHNCYHKQLYSSKPLKRKHEKKANEVYPVM